MQKQQESYYKILEDFAYQKQSVAMAKVLFLIKWRKKLARRVSQIQFISKLANKLKPDCLLKTSVFWLCANKLVTKIVSTMRSVLTLGHSTVPRKKYHPDISTLRSGYSEEGNIQELKARPLLKELAPNINIPSANPPSKQRGLCRQNKTCLFKFAKIRLAPKVSESPRAARALWVDIMPALIY